MKQPIQRKKLSVNIKARNDAYKTLASRLQDSVYEMGQQMPEVNGLFLLNSGVSAQFKGFQTVAEQGKVDALMPLLKELHHPDAQERKRGAAKLVDILKGVRSGSAQEADTPQEHISAAIQHLEKAVHGVVRVPQGQLTAVSAALGKVREAESVVQAMQQDPIHSQSQTHPSGGRKGPNVMHRRRRGSQARSHHGRPQPSDQLFEQPSEQVHHMPGVGNWENAFSIMK
ncbi:hypothetical protein DUNSADRAFT_889 [Dunaliella salina]|uniref:Uncharacterized protein n=1 Tax=Dunaliella salina TaxID=3046 RepID=A0ABQ7H8M8_DUNSA|nr:hypothetical protein DUNSADRAFT_889 [Dunaliella salina]|eukprot:KAF5843213.1 hypothetical protein DUNSADRAFT_889 [Dunaliella salina]